MQRAAADGVVDVKDPNIAAVLLLWEAEHALAVGDYERAVTAADRLPADSAGWALGRLVAATSHDRLEDQRSALVALRPLTAVGLFQGPALVSVAAMFIAIDRETNAEEYLDRVPPDNPARPQATATRIALGNMDGRELLGAAHVLYLPDSTGRWFEPTVPLLAGLAFAGLCHELEANTQLARGLAELDRLEAVLTNANALEDTALWSRWAGDPAYPDRGLRAAVALDPLTTRAVERARAVEVDPKRASDFEIYRADALDWIRRALVDAGDRAAAARELAAGVPERMAQQREWCTGEDPPIPICGSASVYRPRKRWPEREGTTWRHDAEGHWWYAEGWRRERKQSCIDF